MANKTKKENNTNKQNQYITPHGEAVFPRLIEPDTKFDSNGVYSIKLRLPDGPEATALIEKIDAVRQQAFDEAVEAAPNALAKKKVKMAEPSYTWELDRDTGLETNNWLFNFKMKASGLSSKTGKPWQRKPVIFDAKGTPITTFKTNSDIWSGSQVKIAFELRPFYVASFGAGCSHNLLAVQIIELVSGEGKTAEDFGFEQEDAGYTVSNFDDVLTNNNNKEVMAAPISEGDDDGDF